MKNLIGKHIKSIWIDAPKCERMVFECTEGRYAFEAYGDCCSTSWFHEVIGWDKDVWNARYPVEVLAVTEITMGEIPSYGNHEVLEKYRITLETTYGGIDIIYRNDSNGYYGGDCVGSDETSLEGLTQITGDFDSGQ